MEIKVNLLTENKYSRPGTLLKAVKGIVIHWVENPGTTAQGNRNYFESLKSQPPGLDSKKYCYASAHYIIGLDGETIQCVPDKEVCYHVGADVYTPEALDRLSNNPNDSTVGIELCHPSWDGHFTEETLQSCRELVSQLLAAYSLTRDDLWRHYDITKKVCPKYFVDRTDEWDAFKASVTIP
jgi:N-acetylmuramoyl-L-alanine amidase